MQNMRTPQKSFLCLALIAVTRGVLAQTAPAPQPQVEITAATAHTLRLHVSFTGAPSKGSIFIAPQKSPATAEKVKAADSGFAGIQNENGTLLVDKDKGQWMLKGPSGTIVIPATALPTRSTDPRSGKPRVSAAMGSSPAETKIYASGDTNSGLLQQQGGGRVGNGTTGIPYYWTSAGYSVLALGDDDNAPATWQPSGDHGQIIWQVPGDSIDLYLTPTSRLEEATEDYAVLTGRPPVPPRWAFGYMQSRWGWRDRAYIDDTLKQFLDRKLPVDAFIFDFEWYTPQPDYSVPAAGSPTYSDFSFNPALFPEPEKQIADLHAHGVHVVGIRKPRLGNSDLLTQLRSRGWIITAPAAPAAPAGRGRGGLSGATEQRLLDYANPEVCDWYAEQIEPLLKAGIDGWWNDEGEQTYTMYTHWNQSEAQALAKIRPDGRLWTINRAFQPGMQRYGAAAWAGDFLNNWQGLAQTPTRLLNWSLAGEYYGACDIGGFQGNVSPELLTRWMQAGVFFPAMRSHSSNSVTPRFPWLYGDQAEGYIRTALDLRYRLVPYYYSLAHRASQTGTPLMRPLAMEFPDDPEVANMTDQWLMGESLMAAPVLTASSGAGDETGGTRRTIYFPKATWYTLDTNKTHDGGKREQMVVPWDQIPTFIRAGTILPLAPVIQHTDDLPGGPLDLQIYPGANATFTLTEDDGNTTAYATGQIRQTTFSWNDAGHTLTWKIAGPYNGKDIFNEMKVTLFEPSGVVTKNAALDGSGSMTLSQ